MSDMRICVDDAMPCPGDTCWLAGRCQRSATKGKMTEVKSLSDVLRTDGDANPKDIAGRAKPQLHLIPACAEIAVARVMEGGAKKYGPYNWRHKAVAYTPYISAVRRHMLAFADGELNDPESGLSHLAHAASSAMILLDAIQNGCAIDDRVKPGVAGALINPARPNHAQSCPSRTAQPGEITVCNCVPLGRT